MITIKEFFRWTTEREPEGWFSWQHILFVTCCVLATVLLAVIIGKCVRTKGEKAKRKVLLISAIVMVTTELTKIIIISFRNGDPFSFRSMLPLFLCSINLFVIPITGFNCKIKKIATYFVAVYGMLCCLAGTYLAANYYANSPIFCFDVLNSTITHCISGFAAIFIFASGLLNDYDVLTDKTRFFLSPLVLLPIVGLALIANTLNMNTDYESNYMFLTNSAGTPFSIVEDITFHIPALYTVAVVILYLIYGVIFTLIYYAIKKNLRR